MSSGLRAGYARVELTPEVGCTLADAPLGSAFTGAPRLSTSLRDPLYARALHLSSGRTEVTIVVGDLLLITARLHAEVAARAGASRATLVLAATHTHSGPGSYWQAGRAERMVGRFDPRMFERLASGLAEAARRARDDARPATLRASVAAAAGASANRRERLGPVDPDLTLLRFDVAGAAPIDLWSFSAHPVIGSERENGTISADFPGEVCRRIDARGLRSVFLQGAVGGLSPLFPEFPTTYDEHLTLVGDVLERAWEQAQRALVPAAAEPLSVSRPSVALGAVECSVFPSGARWKLAEQALTPLRRWLVRLGEEGREGSTADLHHVRMGDAAFVGAPCDLGVRVALDLKRALRDAGVEYPIAGSQCGGYLGYVMAPADYEHAPEAGFREMALYENAMSLSGRDLGIRWVRELTRTLG